MKIADFAKLEYREIGLYDDDKQLYDSIKKQNCNILRRKDFEYNKFKIEYNNSKGEKRYLLCEYHVHDDGCISGYIFKTEILDEDVEDFFEYNARVWYESRRRGISEEETLKKLIEEEKKEN